MGPLCVNCSMSFHPNFKTTFASGLGEELKLLLEEWAERSVTDDEFICNECLSMLLNSFDTGDRTRKLGHLSICHACGKSLGSRSCRRSAVFPQDHPVAQVALSWHPPRKLETVKLCRGCYMRIESLLSKGNEKTSKKKAPSNFNFAKASKIEKMCLREKKPENVPQTIDTSEQSETEDKVEEEIEEEEMYSPGVSISSEETMTLTKYKRAIRGKGRCMVSGCRNKQMNRLPSLIQEMFLIDHNIYVPRRVMICSKHLKSSDWISVVKQVNVTEEFTKEQIENMCDALKRRQDSAIDFEFVEFMSNSLCKFLTGLRVQEFLEVHESIKWDVEKNSKLALAILLIKLKREQNNEEIKELLGLRYTTVRNELQRAIKCVCATDKTFFGNIEQENLSMKVNASFLPVYIDKDD